MSVGHLCEYCGQGHVRPFQFSLEQAVIACDNVDCDSRLEVSPWDCVVDRKLSQTNLHTLDQGRLVLWSRSSSSSGVHSDYRSPGLSPTRSFDSVTDREVENLLKRSYAPPPGATCHQLQNGLPQYHQSAVIDQKVTEVKSKESFASFFELLNNLDLDVPSHSLVKRECMPMSPPLPLDETGVDSVTSELETWMRSFEVTENIKKKVHSKCSAPASNHQVDGTETIKYHSLPKDRLYIPSKDSAFSQVSPKKDSSRKFGSNAADSGDSEVNGKSENVDIPCVKSCDVSKNTILSICDTQFLSPAASAGSDDSGYEDTAIKANLVLLPSYLSEKEGDCSSSLPTLEEKKDDLSHHSLSPSRGVSKIAIDMKVTDSHEQNTSALLAVVSSGPLSDTIAGKSVKMDLEGENICLQEFSNFNSSGISLSSSQSNETEKNTSEHKTSDNENNGTTTQTISHSFPCKQLCDDNEICTKNSNVEECRLSKRPGRPKGSLRKPPLETICTENSNVEECRLSKRPGRPKGSWRKPSLETICTKNSNVEVCRLSKRPGRPKGSWKQPSLETNCTENSNVEECRLSKRPGRPKGSWKQPPLETVKRNKRVARRPVLRKEEESNIASLKKGLASLLQAPSVQIKKDGNRNQNLTNLSLRSRLSVRYSFCL